MLRAMLLQQYAGGGAFLVRAFHVLLFRLELFLPYKAGQSVDRFGVLHRSSGVIFEKGLGNSAYHKVLLLTFPSISTGDRFASVFGSGWGNPKLDETPLGFAPWVLGADMRLKFLVALPFV